jgi:glycosyltransferase involved in cell wall biosynthesis
MCKYYCHYHSLSPMPQASSSTAPVISIVVPAYNVERYIEQCLRSILGQLRDHHELIVVDDGSTDQTLALAKQLQAGWPGSNFRVLTQTNRGIAAARNHCIGAATGEYLAFVDSDDVLLDDSLALMDKAIAEHRPDCIAFDLRMWHPEKPSKTEVIRLGYPANELMRDPAAILNTFLVDRHMYVWAHVFRREIYGQLPDPIFPPGRVFEDVSTLPRLLSQCATLLHLPHVIIDYRQHPASITKSVSEGWCLDFAAALPLTRHHLEQRGVADSVKRQFDVAAAVFFVRVVKHTYQLPDPIGGRTRDSIKKSFVENLFGGSAGLMDIVRRPDYLSLDRAFDKRVIGQVHSALSNSLRFHLKTTISRKYKMWRNARKLRKNVAAPNLQK